MGNTSGESVNTSSRVVEVLRQVPDIRERDGAINSFEDFGARMQHRMRSDSSLDL